MHNTMFWIINIGCFTGLLYIFGAEVAMGAVFIIVALVNNIGRLLENWGM